MVTILKKRIELSSWRKVLKIVDFITKACMESEVNVDKIEIIGPL